MKAYILNEPGDTTRLQLEELSMPPVEQGEVLIKVKAISINPVDVKTRAGKGVYGRLKDQKPLIIGWDIAGIVENTGDGVSGFKPGDEVFGMVNFPGQVRLMPNMCQHRLHILRSNLKTSRSRKLPLPHLLRLRLTRCW